MYDINGLSSLVFNENFVNEKSAELFVKIVPLISYCQCRFKCVVALIRKIFDFFHRELNFKWQGMKKNYILITEVNI